MKQRMTHIEFKEHEKIYKQIMQQILSDIEKGYLKKGDQLLSIRKATSYYHASKTSILHAYEQLCYDGIVIAKEKKGFFVDVDEEHVRKRVVNKNVDVDFTQYRYDLRSQSVDMFGFDATLWKRYVKDALEHEKLMSTYGDGQGEYFLRKVLSEYVYSMRGVLAKSERIVVASSFQSLCYIVFGLLKEHIVVGMCEPFLPLIRVCQDFDIPYCILKQDDEGVIISSLYEQKINVFYLHTSSHGTLKRFITNKKRKQLLAWAQEQNAYILEDDHNGELHYKSHMEPAIQGFDQVERVIYFGSFSRLILPSIRISYMVLNTNLYQRYMLRKNSYSPSASKIEQYALARYIEDNHLQRQIKRLKKQYLQRFLACEQLLKKYFNDNEIILEECALQFYIGLESEEVCEKVCRDMEKLKIAIGSNKNYLVVSFASLSQDAMAEVISCISQSYQCCKGASVNL